MSGSQAFSGSFTRVGGVYESAPSALVAGSYGILRLTSAGLLMVEAAMTSGSVVQLAAGTALAGKFGFDQTTVGTTNNVTRVPNAATAVGITPVVSATSEVSHVLKASPGNTYRAVAVNLSTVAGWFVLLNATSVGADGAITPLTPPLRLEGFVGAVAGYDFGDVPEVFSVGVCGVLTSAVSPFTQTTSGGLTGFIAGDVK